MNTFKGRIKHAWNAFRARDETVEYTQQINAGTSYFYDPSRTRLSRGNERSILMAVYNRIAMDVAAIDFIHARTDQNGRYIETLKTPFNECLSTSANIDQTGRAFIQDVVLSMFDEGAIAIVPVETSISPKISTGYDIYSLRVGKIIEWFPQMVRVELYNDKKGKREAILLDKSFVAIVENPLYAVMNEPNSTVKRLNRKLNLLDVIDEQSSSGKLDLIIQLPYVIKTATKQQQAEERRKMIEEQLTGSKYGIAYTDGTERITQLNRPAENNLMTQITYLWSMLHDQLGISEKVFNGTADEKEMLNYFSRTVTPIATAITEAMRRSFLTKTARSQHQTIMYFRDIFKLVSALEMAKISDSFTRNEIVSTNEIRSIIGFKPSDDPGADELRNKNMPQRNPAMDIEEDFKEEYIEEE